MTLTAKRQRRIADHLIELAGTLMLDAARLDCGDPPEHTSLVESPQGLTCVISDKAVIAFNRDFREDK